jgi:hypothetical protein
LALSRGPLKIGQRRATKKPFQGVFRLVLPTPQSIESEPFLANFSQRFYQRQISALLTPISRQNQKGTPMTLKTIPRAAAFTFSPRPRPKTLTRPKPNPFRLALTLALTFAIATGVLSETPSALAQETECRASCQTGQTKLAAEKAKNRQREEAKKQLNELAKKAMRDCFKIVYSQNYSLLGFPIPPNLNEALNEICRASQWTLKDQDYGSPQISLQDLIK